MGLFNADAEWKKSLSQVYFMGELTKEPLAPPVEENTLNSWKHISGLVGRYCFLFHFLRWILHQLGAQWQTTCSIVSVQ